MDDILAYLERITQPDDLGQEHSVLMQRVIELEQPILDALSLEYLDRLTEAQSEVLLQERQECFSRGFRLGAQLMLVSLLP